MTPDEEIKATCDCGQGNLCEMCHWPADKEDVIMSKFDQLTAAEKFIWNWRRDQFGGFKRSLLGLIIQADVQNLEKLRLGFPDEVKGYVSYRQTPGWWDNVVKKMEG